MRRTRCALGECGCCSCCSVSVCGQCAAASCGAVSARAGCCVLLAAGRGRSSVVPAAVPGCSCRPLTWPAVFCWPSPGLLCWRAAAVLLLQVGYDAFRAFVVSREQGLREAFSLFDTGEARQTRGQEGDVGGARWRGAPACACAEGLQLAAAAPGRAQQGLQRACALRSQFVLASALRSESCLHVHRAGFAGRTSAWLRLFRPSPVPF